MPDDFRHNPMCCVPATCPTWNTMGLWRNGSASSLQEEGWGFESLGAYRAGHRSVLNRIWGCW